MAMGAAKAMGKTASVDDWLASLAA
jgi:hypothetical protein